MALRIELAPNVLINTHLIPRQSAAALEMIHVREVFNHCTREHVEENEHGNNVPRNKQEIRPGNAATIRFQIIFRRRAHGRLDSIIMHVLIPSFAR